MKNPSIPSRTDGRADPRFVRWAIGLVFAASLVVGAVGVWQRLAHGHLPAGYGSYVPWGLWVALYFHGVGLAGGAFALGAGGYVLDLPGFRSRSMLRATIVLAFAGILPAFMAIWFDLGHLDRAQFIFLYPHFTSMMAFNAWMYNAFMLAAAVCWILSFRPRSDWLKPLLCLGLVFSILFPSQSGAFFGVVGAKAFWHSALLPLLFLTSALTAGSAALLVARSVRHALSPMPNDDEHDVGLTKLRWATIAGVCLYFVLEFAEFSIELWSPNVTPEALWLVLTGPYWWVFWVVHLLLGGVVALALLATRRASLWTAGAALVAVCFVSARLNVLIPGQAVGELHGLQEAFQHPRLDYVYHATGMEYLLGFFLLAVGIAVVFAGRRAELFFRARLASREVSNG